MTATFGNAIANAMMTQLAAAGVFVSLHTDDPATTGANELVGDGYARKAVTWSAASGQQVANSNVITFGPASAEWEEAAYMGLWSAVSGGTFIAGTELTDPVTVPNAGEASFSAAELIFSLDAIS